MWLSVGAPHDIMPRDQGAVQFFAGLEPARNREGRKRKGKGKEVVMAVTPLPVIALRPCSSFDFCGVCVCVCVCAGEENVCMHVMYACMYIVCMHAGLAYRV